MQASKGSGITITGMAYCLPRQRILARVLLDSWDKSSSVTGTGEPKPKLEPELGIMKVARAVPGEIESLVIAAAEKAVHAPGVDTDSIGLILDFSVTGRCVNGVPLGFAVQNKISASSAKVMTIGTSACASFHAALYTAQAMFAMHSDLENVLLVAGETCPERARLMLPLTLLGDGAAAMLLSRGVGHGDELVSVAINSAGGLRDIIGMPTGDAPIQVDIVSLEKKLVVAHLKGVYDTCTDALEKAGISRAGISLLIPPNMNATDQNGYMRVLGMDAGLENRFALPETGHMFGCDNIVNWCWARDHGMLPEKGILLLASSGAGFGWGAAVVELRGR